MSIHHTKIRGESNSLHCHISRFKQNSDDSTVLEAIHSDVPTMSSQNTPVFEVRYNFTNGEFQPVRIVRKVGSAPKRHPHDDWASGHFFIVENHIITELLAVLSALYKMEAPGAPPPAAAALPVPRIVRQSTWDQEPVGDYPRDQKRLLNMIDRSEAEIKKRFLKRCPLHEVDSAYTHFQIGPEKTKRLRSDDRIRFNKTDTGIYIKIFGYVKGMGHPEYNRVHTECEAKKEEIVQFRAQFRAQAALTQQQKESLTALCEEGSRLTRLARVAKIQKLCNEMSKESIHATPVVSFLNKLSKDLESNTTAARIEETERLATLKTSYKLMPSMQKKKARCPEEKPLTYCRACCTLRVGDKVKVCRDEEE